MLSICATVQDRGASRCARPRKAPAAGRVGPTDKTALDAIGATGMPGASAPADCSGACRSQAWRLCNFCTCRSAWRGNREELQEIARPDLRIRRIVLTVATPDTVRLALRLRQRLQASTQIVVHVSGDSTEGFHAFGPLPDTLTEADLLIVSSEAEAAATRACFPNAPVRVLPFPLVDRFRLANEFGAQQPETHRLAYVGRVSEQKNLHTLLVSIWLLRRMSVLPPDVMLDIYGAGDNLGSPNMGLTFSDYESYLHDLTDKLGLTGLVTWHGFKPRDWLFDHVHLQPHILVSPTLHSDENFGASVLASLVNGHRVVAAAWGGHFDFAPWFPDQLNLVPVHRSTRGPVIDPVALARALARALPGGGSFRVDRAGLSRARAAFSEAGVAARTRAALSGIAAPPVPLKRSAVLHTIDRQRARFGGARRIYDGYDDPAAQVFFQAYGMAEPLDFDPTRRYFLPPWVRCSDQMLHIDDPHRGPQRLPCGSGQPPACEVVLCPAMTRQALPRGLVETLAQQGYAFPLPDGFGAA